MSKSRADARPQPGPFIASAQTLVRWECRCQYPPVLLGTYDDRGQIYVKMRRRVWQIDGIVTTLCPRCGAEHTLDLRVIAGRKTEDGGRR